MNTNSYSVYAKYYDALNIDYELWYKIIQNSLPKVVTDKKMIEYGCGTGNILEKYKEQFSVYGVDLSKDMLSEAQKKIPDGKFYCEDMISFSNEEKFDVALCLFDTINHLLEFSQWEEFIQNVADSLLSGGIFIVDANTTQRLEQITTYPPLSKEFDGNYFFMKLLQKNKTNFLFDIRILRKLENGLYKEEKEMIEETTRSGEEIYNLLKCYFSNITVYNDKNEVISQNDFGKNEKNRWIYVCRK